MWGPWARAWVHTLGLTERQWPCLDKRTRWRCTLPCALSVLVVALASPAASAAPIPAATLSVPAQQFIGENFSFTATFDNTSATDTGYGPFIDVILPVIGADGAGAATDDGVDFVNATYLGATVTAIQQTFPSPGGCVPHPYAVDNTGTPVQVCGTPGDKLVVLQLPFGSFVAAQPPAAVTVNATLSNLADLNTPLTIQARAGFQYGADPLDNPTTDPSILGPTAADQSSDSTQWTQSGSITPTLIKLRKDYLGPEDETATGPNYPRQYTITLDIANGQTITNLDVIDKLPNNLAFLTVISTSPAGSVTTTPPVGIAANPPNNQLVVHFNSVTGGPGSSDVTVTFEFFAPQFDANGQSILDPLTGGCVPSINDALATGTWAPIDTRDPTTMFTSDETPNDHQIKLCALVIQKSVAVVTDVGASGPSPGDTLEYTYQFQVSDYFTIGGSGAPPGTLTITDVISDGQHFDTGFAPTVSVTDRGGTSVGSFTGGGNLSVDETQFPPSGACGNGTTTLTFNVSQQLIDIGTQHADGVMQGGRAIAPDAGAATGTMTYRTVIQEAYDCTVPSGNKQLDAHDLLSNAVQISGRVLDNTTLNPTGTTTETSAAGVEITAGGLIKSIYARNGVVGSFTQIAPGDQITYRIQRTLPLSSIEDFSLTDYLPLPVFRAADPDADGVAGPAWTFDPTVSAAAPPTGVAKFGPSDTFFALSSITPTVTPDASANTVQFFYGTYDDSTNSATAIDVLFTVTVTGDPFADGLFLTNQVRDSEHNSFNSPKVQDQIIQFQLTEPVLNIRKGVIATDNPAGTLSPVVALPSNISVSAPGGGCPRLSGAGLPVNSNNLGTTFNSDLSNVDAGDSVTFAIVVENTGSGLNGAFDVRLRDTLPTGFSIPGSGLNLCVTDGTGAAMPFTTLGTGLFDAAGGIELTDPGPTASPAGALDPFDMTSGRNIAVITYDLTLDGTGDPAPVTPRQALTNTATLFNFAGEEGGTDFTTTDLTDDATVTIPPPQVTKVIQSIVPNGTGGSSVTAGDTITYSVTVTLPEGTTPGLVVTDTLPAGFQYVAGSVTVVPGTFNGTLTGSPTVTTSGQDVTIDFGDVTVTDDNDATNNTFTFTLQAKVLDDAVNNVGVPSAQTKTNTVSLNYTGNPGGPLTAQASTTFREPKLTLTKTMTPSNPDAGDTLTITLTVNNTGTSPAYDVVVTDSLPSSLFDLTPLTSVNEGTTPVDFSYSYSSPTVTYTGNPGISIAAGGSRRFTFTAKVRADVVTGSAYQNTGSVTGDSQDGTVTEQRTTNGSGNATANVASSQVAKSIIATSEDSTDPGDASLNSNPPVAIGEVLTFRITFTLPEGTTDNVVLADVLPTGLTYITGTATLDRSSTALTAANDPGGINSNTPGTAVPVTLSGTTGTVSLNAGTVTNTDMNNATPETYILTLTAVVNNSAGNNAGTSLVDRGRIQFANFLGATQTVNSATRTVHVAEPTVQVAKSASPATASGGDLITFTLTISNTAAGTNAASAFDWVIQDTLTSLYLSPMVTGVNVGATGAVANASFTFDPLCGNAANTLCGTIDQLDPGESITITYTATLSNSVLFGQTVLNTASATTTSLPGTNGTGGATPGAAGSASGERTGSGGVNDLTASDPASVSVGLPTIAKTTVAPQTYYAIGETPVFQITLGVPEGATTNFVVTDVLPAGLAFNVGTLSATLPAGITSTRGASPLTDATPSFFSQAGNTLILDFGNIAASAAGNIVITYATTVQNVIANQDGTLLTNMTSLRFDDPDGPGQLTVGPVNNTSPVRVGEPNLDMTKTITAGATGSDAGDTVSWQVKIQNAGHTTAFQVNWQDVLPNGLFQISNVSVSASGGNVLLNGTATAVTAGDAVVATTLNTNDTVSLPPLQIEAGATLTVDFDSVLTNTVVAGQVLNNATRANYTSLVSGGRDNSSNPGNVDDDDDSVLNNYEESTSQSLTVASPVAIDKTVSPTTYTIGQTLTYHIRVDVIQGITPSLVVTDVLPAGLTYVSHSIAFGHMAILPSNATFNTRLGSGQTVQFDFGDVSNPDDGNLTDDFISIDLTARVDNVLANQNLTVLKNGEVADGSALLAQFGSGPPTQVNFDSDGATAGIQGLPITIVEPDLAVTKTASPASQSLGDVVTYTVTVQHTASSTADAFDLVLNDVLPAGLTYVPGSATLPPADVTAAGQNLQFRIASLTLLTGSTSFTYQARIDVNAVVGVPLSNNIQLTWSSLAGATGAADNGRTGADGPGGGLNNYATSAQTPVTPNANAFIDATKTVVNLSGGLAMPGNTLEYTVTLKNLNGPATGVVFTDQVPVGTTYVAGSLTTTLGSVNDSGAPQLVVTIGNLASMATVTITFRVTVNASTPDGFVISNQGSVDSNQTVPEPTDEDGNDANGDQPTTIVVGLPSAGLHAVKSVQLTGDTVAPTGTINTGDTVTYTISLSNTGATDLTNVTFTDTIPTGPPGVTVTAITTTQGTAPLASNNVSIPDIGTIPSGGIVTITVTGTVVGTGTVSNQGAAGSDQVPSVLTDGNGDPTDGDQPTVFTVQGPGVSGTPQLQVRKLVALLIDTNGDGIINAGEVIRYTIAVENAGSTAATNVVLSDPLPANLTLVPGSVVTSHGSVVSTSPTTVVNIGTLNPGETATVTLDLTIAAGLPNGTVISNQATVTDGQGDNVPSDDPAPPGPADPTLFTLGGPNTLSGFVYEDANNDGVKDPGERGLGGVTIVLMGTDNLGHFVLRTTITAADGSYSFTNLRPGTYAIAEIQARGFADGIDTIGSQGGSTTNDRFSNIVIVGSGFSGVLNDFGERQIPPRPSCQCDNGTPVCQPGAKNAGTECTKASDCLGNPPGVVPGSAADLCGCGINGGILAGCKNGSLVGNRDDVPDACRSNCELPACGDGISDSGEQCDNGAKNGDDKPCVGNAPNSVCAVGATIFENPFIPGATIKCSTDADCFVLSGGLATCTGNPQCRLNVCGDGRVCTDPNCTSGDTPVTSAAPGLPAPEACDDGNTSDLDGCTSFNFAADIGGAAIPDHCQLNACGDGVTNDATEQCDAGAAICISGARIGRPCCTNDDCRAGDIPGQCSGDGGATNVSGFDNRSDVPDGTAGNVSCRCNCMLPFCGDGVSDSLDGEECDDGNTVTGPRDYCNAVRRCVGGENPGALCTTDASCTKGTCGNVQCEQNACGDGITSNNEECDDGNTVAASGFDVCGITPAAAAANAKPIGCDPSLPQNLPGACIPAACRLPLCGDGVTAGGETCDAGTATCTGGFNPGHPCAKATDCIGGTCGAGNRDDVPNACRSNCMFSICGDGVSDTGEQCDDGANNGNNKRCLASVTNPLTQAVSHCVLNVCGDGKICTDPGCISGPTCNPITGECTAGGGPEQCDDGNTVNPTATNGDACSSICAGPRCGDGVTNPGEQCDGVMPGCSNENANLGDCCFDGDVVDAAQFSGPGLISVDTAFTALLGCRLPNLVAQAACDGKLQKALKRAQNRVTAAQVYYENDAFTGSRRLLRVASGRLHALNSLIASLGKPGRHCAANALLIAREKQDAAALVDGLLAHLGNR